MKLKKPIIILGIVIILLVILLIVTLIFRSFKASDNKGNNIEAIDNNEYLEKLALEIQSNQEFNNSSVLVDQNKITIYTEKEEVIYSTTFELIDDILVYEFPNTEDMQILEVNDEIIWKLKDVIALLQGNNVTDIENWNATANLENMNVSDNGISLIRNQNGENNYIMSFEISTNNLQLTS